MYTILNRLDKIENLLQSSSPSYRGIGDIHDKRHMQVETDASCLYFEDGVRTSPVVGTHTVDNDYQISSTDSGSVYLSQIPDRIRNAAEWMRNLPRDELSISHQVVDERLSTMSPKELDLLSKYLNPSGLDRIRIIGTPPGHRNVSPGILSLGFSFDELTPEVLDYMQLKVKLLQSLEDKLQDLLQSQPKKRKKK